MNWNQNLARSQLFTIQASSITVSPEFSVLAPASKLAIGLVIDRRYRIRQLIGEGGMGAVYRAYHIPLDKDVALKTLLTPSFNSADWNKFQNESKILARLDHPNVVKVLDCGIGEDGFPFYTMELLAGQSLSEKLDEEQLDPETAVRLFIQASRGLAAAHDKGIIHKDIKPANIFLADSQSEARGKGSVKIIDFGIASMAASTQDHSSHSDSGCVFGSPLYMSPEQCRGDTLTKATDIYSCGCALFEALVGEPPFIGDNAFDTICMHLTAEPPQLSSMLDEAIPQRLSNLLNAMLAKDPKSRPGSFHDIEAELSSVLQVMQTGNTAKYTMTYSTNRTEYDHRPEPADQAHPSRNPLVYVLAAGLLLGACSLPLIFMAQPKEQQPTAGSSRYFETMGAIQDALKTGDEATLHSARAKETPPGENAKEIPVSSTESPLPVKSLNEKAPYSELVDGGRVRKFQFPEDITIGMVAGGDLNFRKAGGPFSVRVNEYMVFKPARVLLKYPQYIQRFRAGDVSVIVLDDKTGTDEMLALMRGIHGAYQLDLLGCSKLDAHSLKMLKDLPSIKELAFGNCGFSPDDIARLPDLNRFDHIFCMDQRSNDLLLKQLAKNRSLKLLSLDSTTVTIEGFREIAKMSSLNTLSLQKSRFDMRDLEQLSACANLRFLSLTSQTIDPQVLSLLKRLKKLQRLKVSPSRYKSITKQAIKEALPNVEIEELELG